MRLFHFAPFQLQKLSRAMLAAAVFAVAVPVLAPALLASDPVRLALEHDRLTAQDLARVVSGWGEVDAETVVAYAPLPGVKRRVSRGQLVRWGRRFGLDLNPAQLPDALVISRRMRKLKEPEAERALRNAVAERFGVDPGDVQVQIHDFEAPLVPAGELTFQVSSSFSRLNQPSSIALRWRDPGGRSSSIWLKAAVSVLGSYAVASEALAARTRLSPGDLAFHNGPLPGAPDRFLLTREEIKGMSLKHPLKAGEPLRRSSLIKIPIVRRGDLLELQLQSGSILLRVPGRAEQSGSEGDTITCSNLESGKKVSARILDAKHAEVEWIQ